MESKNSDKETASRRDEALRRALTTPYKAQETLKKAKANLVKRTTGKGRARVGKGRS